MLWRAILMLCMLLALAQGALAADIPPVGDNDLEQALLLAGSNRAQLEQALFACQQKPFTMEAMRFLVANLPAADLGVVTAADLVQHVELAMSARAEFGYAQGYDDATWAHYVLPPRVSQEPLSPWRPYFYDQLRDEVTGSATREEAAVAINAWCGQRVTYKPTQSRDQGPLITLKSGYGRCEEEVIFFVCACRSVGIPARQAYCPYWSAGDDNHAWAEVLGSDGRWHFTGACEPAPTLDSAWFGTSVKNAPLIASVSYGLPGSTDLRWGSVIVNECEEEVLSLQDAPGARFCLLNSTANYRQTGRITLEADVQNETARLGVYVFNYGALRLIARVPYRLGAASIALGPGTYVLSTASSTGPAAMLFEVEPGVESRFEWAAQAPLPAELVLHFPADEAL
jgi:hypothetical protein